MAEDRAEARRRRSAVERPAAGVGGDLKTPKEFLDLLNAMRDSRKVSYRQIKERAGAGMAKSTAQAMLTGNTLPPLQKLELFLIGCNVPAEERRRWINTWHRINQSASQANDTASEGRAATESPAATPQTSEDAPPAPSSQPPAPPAAAPTPPPPQRPRHRGDRRRLRFALLALTAFTFVVGVLTASAILMWVHQVPTEIMFAVYGLLALSVTSWMMVAQRYPPPPERPHRSLVREEPADVMVRSAKPVIGE
ncbi:hypothetical protein AB0A74_26490 [Saccharothrix sp. NPDC042600]|uniref:hypothetical protein n=1 Tax=Saccharothrix TaxID=2071 RepID=UPI0033D8C9DA